MKTFTFTDALVLAAEAHRGVSDKGGVEYIKHPLTLAMRLKDKGFSEIYQIVALLHDVVEDTDWTLDMLRDEGLCEESIEALDLLTHVPDKEFIKKNSYVNTSGCDFVLAGQLRHEQRIIAREMEYLEYVKEISKNDIASEVKMEDLEHNSDIDRVIPGDLDNDIKNGHRLVKYSKARLILKNRNK